MGRTAAIWCATKLAGQTDAAAGWCLNSVQVPVTLKAPRHEHQRDLQHLPLHQHSTHGSPVWRLMEEDDHRPAPVYTDDSRCAGAGAAISSRPMMPRNAFRGIPLRGRAAALCAAAPGASAGGGVRQVRGGETHLPHPAASCVLSYRAPGRWIAGGAGKGSESVPRGQGAWALMGVAHTHADLHLSRAMNGAVHRPRAACATNARKSWQPGAQASHRKRAQIVAVKSSPAHRTLRAITWQATHAFFARSLSLPCHLSLHLSSPLALAGGWR